MQTKKAVIFKWSVDLGTNASGLEQYTALIQFDFFADSPRDAYRLIIDKLMALYSKVESIEEQEGNSRGICLKRILQVEDKEGNIVASWIDGKIRFTE